MGESIMTLPVGILQIAMAQISNPGATQLSQAAEWSRVGIGAQQHIHPVTATFQRRTVVG